MESIFAVRLRNRSRTPWQWSATEFFVHGTVLDNILAGRPNATREDAIAALRDLVV